MKQKRAHYGNALEYQKLQDRNPVEATEIQPYINKYGLQLLVHVGRGESHTQLQPNDFWIGTLSVIPIYKGEGVWNSIPFIFLCRRKRLMLFP